MTAYRPADSVVFGPHRGGVFLHAPIQGVPTDPAWCACGRHRVERAGQVCPLCKGDT